MKRCKLNKFISREEYERAYNFIIKFLCSKRKRLKFSIGYLEKINDTTFILKCDKSFSDIKINYDFNLLLKVLSTIPENSYIIVKLKFINKYNKLDYKDKRIQHYENYKFRITGLKSTDKNCKDDLLLENKNISDILKV